MNEKLEVLVSKWKEAAELTWKELLQYLIKVVDLVKGKVKDFETPEPPKMFFSEMSLEEIHTYLKWKIAQEVIPRHELQDIPSDVALLGVKTDIEKFLPCGPEAPGNHFWRIEIVLEDGMTPVGGLWFQHGGGKTGMLLGIDIFSMHRKKGYARGAMMELHAAARNMGVEVISLHVYPNNEDALSLYEGMDYVATNLFMRCKL